MVKQSICTLEDGAGQLIWLWQVGLGQEEEISQGAPEEPQSEQGSGQEAEAQETQKILLSQQWFRCARGEIRICKDMRIWQLQWYFYQPCFILDSSYDRRRDRRRRDREKEKLPEVERLAEIERKKTAGDREKEIEARKVEIEANRYCDDDDWPG